MSKSAISRETLVIGKSEHVALGSTSNRISKIGVGMYLKISNFGNHLISLLPILVNVP